VIFSPGRPRRSALLLAGPLSCGLAAIAVGLVAVWGMGRAGRTVPVDLPTVGGEAAELDPNFSGHVISVRRDGSYALGGARLPRSELAARLRRLGELPRAAEERILVRADAAAPFEKVVDLLQLCRGAGLTAVGFEVLEESAP
jgi:biopolymer transport protein ExbD